MICLLVNGGMPDDVGLIPSMLDENDPRPACEQLDSGYSHGGGWQPFGQDKFRFDPRTSSLRYPGDPPLQPLAAIHLRKELILVYPHALVLVLQPSGEFEICRMD